MKNILLSIAGTGSGLGFGRRERDDRPYLFLIFSVAIHILALWVFATLGNSPLKLFVVPIETPFEIDIVELPENFRGALKVPDKVTAFAQRSQEVEKEEYPKRSERAAKTPASPAASPTVIAIITPGGGERGEGGKETVIKRSSQNKTPDKIIDKGIKKEEEIDFTLSLMPEILRPESGVKEKAGEGAGTAIVRLFPTEGSLQQIAHEEKTGVDSPKKGSGMTLLLNTSEFKYQKYFMNIKRRIEFYWDYPHLAARNGQQGRLNIDFKIHKDGIIETGSIDIIKSSNYPILDDAATTALRLASPFNPFPEGFGVEDITVHGSFEYSLIRRKR